MLLCHVELVELLTAQLKHYSAIVLIFFHILVLHEYMYCVLTEYTALKLVLNILAIY